MSICNQSSIILLMYGILEQTNGKVFESIVIMHHRATACGAVF